MERHAYNLWIAFLSRNVWDKNGGKAKPPNTMDLAMFYNPDFFCEYLWTNLVPESGLPVLRLRSGRQWLARDRHNKGKLHYFSLPPPYENGYTLAEARWLAETNVAGTIMPTKFEFSYFVPKNRAAVVDDLKTWYTFRCFVTNTYTAQLESIPAGFQGNQMVLVWDHRFASAGHPTITYGITNAWSGTVDANTIARLNNLPRESLEHESLRRDGFAPPAERAYTRPLIRITMAALITLPLIVYMVRGIHKRQKKLISNERLNNEEW
jgi:hypothetical protein